MYWGWSYSNEVLPNFRGKKKKKERNSTEGQRSKFTGTFIFNLAPLAKRYGSWSKEQAQQAASIIG